MEIDKSKTGRNRLSSPHQTEFDPIFGRRRCVFPEYTLDGNHVEGVSRQENIIAGKSEASDNTNSPEASTSGQAKKKTKHSHPAVALKLDEIVEEHVQLRSDVLDFLQKKEDRRREERAEQFERSYAKKEEHARQRKERASQREERSRQKLLLLEKIIQKS